MNKTGAFLVGRRYAGSFFAAYFLYYAAYCIFSSYVVLYLTERSYSATVCGIITSLALLANLAIEPVGGYITDTFFTTKRYLAVCIGAVALLCIFCTIFSETPLFLLPAMVLSAGIVYSFGQLMDAWVNMSREKAPWLNYSRIRAGGSIGFAGMSVLGGYYFKCRGWDGYFLMQMLLLLLMAPFLLLLPDVGLGNRKNRVFGKGRLSPAAAFKIAAKNKKFCFCLLICTFYWFSHRPVGSYLSLLAANRGGDAGTYGSICAVGAVIESVSLLILPWVIKKRPISSIRCLTTALAANLLRPVCLLLFPGIWSLYLGQMLQSVGFALFYSSSLDCFAETSDCRIRSFCISFGLMAGSVVGTVLANLLGGILCDIWGVGSLIWFSLCAAAINLAGCCMEVKKIW